MKFDPKRLSCLLVMVGAAACSATPDGSRESTNDVQPNAGESAVHAGSDARKAAAGGTSPAANAAVDDERALQARAESLAGYVARLAPAVDDAVKVMVNRQVEFFAAEAEHLVTRLPLKNSGWVELLLRGQAPDAGLRVGLPLASVESPAVLARDGTVTYPNGLPSTDVAVQTFDSLVRIQTILLDRGAPTEFVYPVDLGAGGTIARGDDGSLLVVGSDGAPLGGFGVPWARDAERREIATRYEVRGNTVVQIVDHRGGDVAYPVVADPWLGRDLIDHAEWRRLSEGWQLKVTPTGWAKIWSGALPANAGWNELYAKYKDRGLNTNLGSMKNQYLCHHLFNLGGQLGGPTWDLEEWRPDIGLARFTAARCNPGGSSSSSN